MPSGDFNRSIERERERGEERESEGGNRTSSTPVAGATGSQRCDGKIQVFFLFLFSSNLPKMTDSISK